MAEYISDDAGPGAMVGRLPPLSCSSSNYPRASAGQQTVPGVLDIVFWEQARYVDEAESSGAFECKRNVVLQKSDNWRLTVGFELH